MENSHLTGQTEQEFLTIKEASEFTGKSIAVIYKHIKRGKLTVENRSIDQYNTSQIVKTIAKSDLIKFFKLKSINQSNDRYYTGIIPVENFENQIKSVLNKFFEEKEAVLMKPLEQQALFIAGKLTQENQELKQKFDTILEENRQLREHIKMLPGTVEEVTNKMQELQDKISIVEKEKEEKTIAINKLEQEITELQDKLNKFPMETDKIKAELQEKEQTLSELQKQIANKEMALANAKSQNEEIISGLQQEHEEASKKFTEELEKTQFEKELALKQADEQTWQLKSKIEHIETEKTDTISKYNKNKTYFKVAITGCVLFILVLCLIIPKLLNMEAVSKTAEQLKAQATQNAIELTSARQKEEILIKLNSAHQLLSEKKYEDAIKAYDEILQTEPNNIIAIDNRNQALYLYGNNLCQEEKYTEAIELYNKCLSLQENNIEVLIAKGKALEKLNQPDEALTCYNKALSIDPNNPDIKMLINPIR